MKKTLQILILSIVAFSCGCTSELADAQEQEKIEMGKSETEIEKEWYPGKDDKKREKIEMGKSDSELVEIISKFYTLLLSEEKVTLKQEKELFDFLSLRGYLLKKYKLKENEPVLLKHFRKHRSLFAQKNMKPTVKRIYITTPYGYSRLCTRTREYRNAGQGFVSVHIIDKTDDKKHDCFREVLFQFHDGKIGAIYFGGISGELAIEKWIKFPPSAPAK